MGAAIGHAKSETGFRKTGELVFFLFRIDLPVFFNGFGQGFFRIVDPQGKQLGGGFPGSVCIFVHGKKNAVAFVIRNIHAVAVLVIYRGEFEIEFTLTFTSLDHFGKIGAHVFWFNRNKGPVGPSVQTLF